MDQSKNKNLQQNYFYNHFSRLPFEIVYWHFSKHVQNWTKCRPNSYLRVTNTTKIEGFGEDGWQGSMIFYYN